MKKIAVIILSLGLAFGASAQAKINRGGAVRGFGPGVAVVRVAPIYPVYGMGWGSPFMSRFSPFYNPFYDPFYADRRFEARPSKLDLEIDDIRNEYSHKISTVKNDKSIEKQERKQKVRDLKHQREDAIIEAKKRFYRDEDRESSK